jgi:hypothetical protein
MGCSPPGKAGGAAETTRRAVTEEHDMRRAIPIFAAALLASGAGCTTRNCDYGTLTIDWSFPDVSGNDLGCAVAGVSYVTITIDGVPQTDENGDTLIGCSPQFIQYAPFATATQSVLIEGLDANQQVLYSSGQLAVDTNGCGDVSVDVALSGLSGVPGDLTVSYQFTDSDFCTNANTFIWYELLDENNQTVDLVDDTHGPTDIACGQTIFLGGLPFGNYTVSRIQEVEFVGGGAFVTHHATCDAQAVPHFTAGETVTVLVPPSNGNCF